jgi:hypothetical protein
MAPPTAPVAPATATLYSLLDLLIVQSSRKKYPYDGLKKLAIVKRQGKG